MAVGEQSRPTTPDSSLANSLHQAMATIDDMTITLSNFSRTATPEPPNLLQCCCHEEICEPRQAWMTYKTKLESRLVLSAEVGQALLRKLEAHIRRHDSPHTPADSQTLHAEGSCSPSIEGGKAETDNIDDEDVRAIEMLKEHSALQKRLNAALINAEIVEASNESLLNDLQEAQTTISSLSAYRAKSAGWDVRLDVALRDLEDLRQERDNEEQRAKLAEARVVTLTDKCSKFQAQVHYLYDALTQQRQTDAERSEEILRDARARVEMLQHSQLRSPVMFEHDEVNETIQSLFHENGALKGEAAEMKDLLAESREQLRALREGVEAESVRPSLALEANSGYWQPSFDLNDLRPSAQQSPASPPLFSSSLPARRHFVNHLPKGINALVPLTPETAIRPLTPADSIVQLNSQSPCVSPQPRHHTPQETFADDTDGIRINSLDMVTKPMPRRPLLLLTQNKGIQTESWGSLLDVPANWRDHLSSSSTQPHDGRSESSSQAEGILSPVAALLDRVNGLLIRMTQADALTLTNRLKRQRLFAGDVGHVSRSTINNIISEVNDLRQHFKFVLEDEKILWTRKDYGFLLRLLREIFNELGQMRSTLNEVVLDPSIAIHLSEMVMNPSKAGEIERGQMMRSSQGLSGWVAPITKLFGAQLADDRASHHRILDPLRQSKHEGRHLSPRPVPKLGPALAASTTTVNVEFSKAGFGQVVSSTAAMDKGEGSLELPVLTAIGSGSSKAVMDIFAGAPRHRERDSWIVVRKPSSKQASSPHSDVRRNRTKLECDAVQDVGKLSRNLDAILESRPPVADNTDVQEEFPTTLLQRTLRPRGLSDSSIHSTFVAAGRNISSVHKQSPTPMQADSSSPRQGTYPDKQSFLQALSKTVLNFTIPMKPLPWSDLGTASSSAIAAQARQSIPIRARDTNTRLETTHSIQIAPSPRGINVLPNLASWAVVSAGLKGELVDEFVGSVIEESAGMGSVHGPQWNRDMLGRNI